MQDAIFAAVTVTLDLKGLLTTFILFFLSVLVLVILFSLGAKHIKGIKMEIFILRKTLIKSCVQCLFSSKLSKVFLMGAVTEHGESYILEAKFYSFNSQAFFIYSVGLQSTKCRCDQAFALNLSQLLKGRGPSVGAFHCLFPGGMISIRYSLVSLFRLCVSWVQLLVPHQY